MAVAVAALLALSFLPNLLVGRQRKKRYQELRDERRRLGR
jgi:hypothetical protein